MAVPRADLGVRFAVRAVLPRGLADHSDLLPTPGVDSAPGRAAAHRGAAPSRPRRRGQPGRRAGDAGARGADSAERPDLPAVSARWPARPSVIPAGLAAALLPPGVPVVGIGS